MFYLKAGFHMIADRRSQIAIRSAIVCDHMETTSAIAIAEDRIMCYLKAGFHMVANDRRSQKIADDRKKGCFHMYATIAEPTVAIRFGQRKCQIYTRV